MRLSYNKFMTRFIKKERNEEQRSVKSWSYKIIIVFSDPSKDATYPAVIHWFDDDTKIHLISKDVYNFKKSFETTSSGKGLLFTNQILYLHRKNCQITPFYNNNAKTPQRGQITIKRILSLKRIKKTYNECLFHCYSQCAIYKQCSS